MKTPPWPVLSLVALLAAGSCPRADAGLFSDKFEMLVVAERAKDAPTESSDPVSYVAFDGGYIEAGDPIAGETPPTADQVRRSLGAALNAQGFRSTQGSPSLVLAYYWGVLRVDHSQIRSPFGIKTNLRARIGLVSTQQLGAEVENHILGQKSGSSVDMNASSPTLLVGPLESVVQNARLPRIFVVVSAYDYQGLAKRHEAKLVWSVKLSAQETSGEVSEVIPSLVASGAPFFGKDLRDVRIVKTSLTARTPSGSGEPSNLQSSAESYNLDNPFIQSLLKRDRARVSGTDDTGA